MSNNPFDRAKDLNAAFRQKKNLEAQYNNGIIPENMYRAELKVLMAKIKELGG